MVYLFDYKFNTDMQVIRGLNQVFGLGYNTAIVVCSKIGISEKTCFGELDSVKLRLLMRNVLNQYKINLDLKRLISKNIKKKIVLRTYQGIRHSQSLPVNGQRTKTNAKTVKRMLGKFNV